MSMVVFEKSLLCSKVTLCIMPVARPVDRILLELTGRILVLLASSAGRWSGSKGGRPAEASLDTL